MKTQATARYIRVPASKARLVLDHIRGKSVGEALATLQLAPKAAARFGGAGVPSALFWIGASRAEALEQGRRIARGSS